MDVDHEPQTTNASHRSIPFPLVFCPHLHPPAKKAFSAHLFHIFPSSHLPIFRPSPALGVPNSHWITQDEGQPVDEVVFCTGPHENENENQNCFGFFYSVPFWGFSVLPSFFIVSASGIIPGTFVIDSPWMNINSIRFIACIRLIGSIRFTSRLAQVLILYLHTCDTIPPIPSRYLLDTSSTSNAPYLEVGLSVLSPSSLFRP